MLCRFDFDGSGFIEANELMKVGQARREKGHKNSAWTKEKNAALVRAIDLNGDGKIAVEEFIRHFNSALPSGKEVRSTHAEAQ